MKEIQDTDPGKCFRNNVRQDGACGVGIHGRELGRDVVELREGIDKNKDVGEVESGVVPEDHPS